MADLVSATQIAYATMKARKMTILKATEAVAKSLDLTQGERNLLERCLIELRLGIGDDAQEWDRRPSEWVQLYKEAVLSKDVCTLGGMDACSPAQAEAVLADYLAKHMY